METLEGRKIKGFRKGFAVAFKLNQTIIRKKKRKKIQKMFRVAFT